MSEQNQLNQQLIEVKAIAFEKIFQLERAEQVNQQLKSILTEVASIAGIDATNGLDVNALLGTLRTKFAEQPEVVVN